MWYKISKIRRHVPQSGVLSKNDDMSFPKMTTRPAKRVFSPNFTVTDGKDMRKGIFTRGRGDESVPHEILLYNFNVHQARLSLSLKRSKLRNHQRRRVDVFPLGGRFG